jgi:hypothetical protein
VPDVEFVVIDQMLEFEFPDEGLTGDEESSITLLDRDKDW